MTDVHVPWGAWYRDSGLSLRFPDSWDTHVAQIRGDQPLDSASRTQAIMNPIGTASLQEIASGRRDAVIAVDDITRPTPAADLLPPILTALERGGVSADRIRIVVASGAHRPAVRADLDRKIGRRLARSLDVYVHNPYEGLTYLGTSQAGIPIYLNRVFLQGDLKIAVGGITPHESVGWGGGRKTVAIGLAGIETLQAFHALDGPVQTGHMHGNPQHANLVEIARLAGLEFVVNAVFTMNRGISALVAGDPIAAHETGVELARAHYATPVPFGADVVVLNAYPKDTDLLQSCMALNVTWIPTPAIVRPGGSIVITTPCSEGVGLHFLSGNGMRAPFSWPEALFADYHVSIVSPNLSAQEIRRHFPCHVSHHRRWSDAIRELIKRHGESARVVVYPCAALHIPEAE